MLKQTLLSIATCLFFNLSVHAEAPVQVDEIAPLSDLVFEVNSQVKVLEKGLAEEDGYEEKRGQQIRQSFGLLACLGQALAEHSEGSKSSIQGAHLRDAALKFQRKSSFAEAKAALAQVKVAQAGNATGDVVKEHPWNKLINMHPMMEEINTRNSAILKVLRRPRGKESEPVHATTWAILGLAMKADTHEVKNKADLPEWNKQSEAFISASVKLAAAIRAKDKTEGRKWFDVAQESCDACHSVFQ